MSARGCECGFVDKPMEADFNVLGSCRTFRLGSFISNFVRATGRIAVLERQRLGDRLEDVRKAHAAAEKARAAEDAAAVVKTAVAHFDSADSKDSQGMLIERC